MMHDLLEEFNKRMVSDEQLKYKKQEKQLLSLVSEDIQQAFKDFECVIAGGAITSVFTNKEVNDLDVYFPSLDHLKGFIMSMFGELNKVTPKEVVSFATVFPLSEDLPSFELQYRGHTKKSIVCITQDGQEVQLIHNRFYKDAQEIFDSFDFHLNMGSYSFVDDTFTLSDNFLLDNSSRSMTVNPKTLFPIISQLRIEKYIQRGYNINRKEFITLACAVAKLNLESWDDVKSAIGGMYGHNVEDMFDEDKDFNYDELFAQLLLLEYDDTRWKGLDCFCDCDKLIAFIEQQHKGE